MTNDNTAALNIEKKLLIPSWGLANGKTIPYYLGKIKVNICGVNTTDGLRFFAMFDNGRDFADFYNMFKKGKISHKKAYEAVKPYFELFVSLNGAQLKELESLLREERDNSTPFLADAFASRCHG